MDEKVVDAEDYKKPKRKKDAWFYIMVLGQWACVIALILTCTYVYTQAEVLKTSPCDVCEDELGFTCTDYKTGQGYDSLEERKARAKNDRSLEVINLSELPDYMRRF